MQYILDAVLLAFIAAMVIKSSRNTILKALLNTASLVLTVVASCRISILLAHMSFVYFFRGAIASRIEINVEKISVMYGSSGMVERVLRFMPGFVREGALEYGLNNAENTQRLETIFQESSASEAAMQISDMFAGPVIEGIFRAVFMVLLCFGFFYIYKTFCSVIENTVISPSVCFVDPVFGGVLGAVCAVLIVLVVMSTLGLILPIFEQTNFFVQNGIQKSILGQLFYDKNLLNFFIADVKYIS